MVIRQVNCPSPRSLSSGESVCPACGRIWDRQDGRPECEGPFRPSSNLAAVVARRELAKIRAMLSEETDDNGRRP